MLKKNVLIIIIIFTVSLHLKNWHVTVTLDMSFYQERIVKRFIGLIPKVPPNMIFNASHFNQFIRDNLTEGAAWMFLLVLST